MLPMIFRLLAVAVLAGCGGSGGRNSGSSDGGSQPDAGADASADAAPDAGFADGGGEAGPDGGACETPDADGDGFASETCGGDDCDDADPWIHPGGLEASAWESVQVADAGGVGGPPVLAAGPDGSLHLAWQYGQIEGGLGLRTEIRYATDASGAWVEEILAPTGGELDETPAIAVDGAAVVHVAYYRRDKDAIRVVLGERAGGAFVYEAVDTVGVAGANVALAFDEDDVPHLAYQDFSDGAIRYATRDIGWTVEDPDPDDEWTLRAGLLVDSGGGGGGAVGVHIVRIFGAEGERTGDVGRLDRFLGAWDASSPIAGEYASPAIGQEDDGDPVVVGGAGADDFVLLLDGDDGDWGEAPLDPGDESHFLNAGMWTSVARGGSSLHAAYLHGTGPGFADPGEVRHARLDADGRWGFETATSAPLLGAGASIAIAPDGTVHIAYLEQADLMIASSAPAEDGVDSDCDGID